MAEMGKFYENCKENENEHSDMFWYFILMCLLFGMPFSQTDSKLREEVAELKGKVSVLEKLAVEDRRG